MIEFTLSTLIRSAFAVSMIGASCSASRLFLANKKRDDIIRIGYNRMKDEDFGFVYKSDVVRAYLDKKK